MRFGLVARKSLEGLMAEQDKDYDVYQYLHDCGDAVTSVVPGGPLLSPQDYDALFFIYYPFTPAVAESQRYLEGVVPVVNAPSGVLRTSEKTYELEVFPHYLPDSLLLTPEADVEGFLFSYDSTILKPVNGTGGKGIELLDRSALAEQGERLFGLAQERPGKYLLQEFIPNRGDKRVICYDGCVLGHLGRYNPHKYVNNISAGGGYVDLPLLPAEVRMCEDIAGTLRAEGVPFIGVDVIDGRLIEVNTASPGGLRVIAPYGTSAHPFETFRALTHDLARRGL
ncbi:hypothetical protein JXA12_00100 [Candidatus Woesearchaeota archaeon]|nr:hypothetical protein [Candidatus Woesearchaeota archaeon]